MVCISSDAAMSARDFHVRTVTCRWPDAQATMSSVRNIPVAGPLFVCPVISVYENRNANKEPRLIATSAKECGFRDDRCRQGRGVHCLVHCHRSRLQNQWYRPRGELSAIEKDTEEGLPKTPRKGH